MFNEAKTNSESDSSPDLHAVMKDVAELKRDIALLVRNMKFDVSGEVASVRGVVDHLSDEALEVYERLAAQSERSAKAIGRKIEEQPVASLLIAFAVGFLGSRLTWHRDV